MTHIISLQLAVHNIMTPDPVSVSPDMLMTEVAEIFTKHNFHHIPVINETKRCIGIISRSDFLQLQDKFTKFNCVTSDTINQQYFDSLLVSEVMTLNPVSLEKDETVQDAINIFEDNTIRSVVVLKDGVCVGIVTPYDILTHLNNNFA